VIGRTYLLLIQVSF